MTEPVRPARTLHPRRPHLDGVIERYWAAFHCEPGLIVDHVVGCFARTGRLESPALAEAVVGHRAIVDHVRRVRGAMADASLHPHTDVQWSHRTARWCWRWSTRRGSVRGMDVARFDGDDDRIVLLVVFPGLLPPTRHQPAHHPREGTNDAVPPPTSNDR